MDSCTSSIITAYLLSLQLESARTTTDSSAKSTSVFPLLNIPRQDLNLRSDIKFILNKVGVSPSSLTFIDDLTAIPPANFQGSQAFLVDHNKLVGTTEKLFESRVVGIIDHHDDEGFYQAQLQQGPRAIQKTGSCSSLVTKYFTSVLGPQLFANDQELALLGLAPLLADTSAMKSSKVEDPDREALKIYQSSLGYTDEQVEELYNTIDDLKRDVSELTGQEFLRKDYKEWSPETSGLGKIGISSMVKSLNYLFSTYPNFVGDLNAWGQARNLDVMVLNCSYNTKEGGKFKRDLLIWSPSGAFSQRIVDIIGEISDELKLRPLELDNQVTTLSSDIHLFHQGNTKASRKQLAPLLKFHVQGIPLNSL